MPTGTNKDSLHLATHSGWYRFERHGDDWVQADRALTFWQMSCIQVDPDHPRRVYIGTEHSGMFVSDDGGKEWTRANPNVPCLTLSSMLSLPGKFLVGTMPAALYCKPEDGGWQELKGVRQGAIGGTFPPNPDFPARTRVLTREKKTGGRLFAGIEVAGILISDDDGQSWHAANDGLTDPDIHQILPSKGFRPGRDRFRRRSFAQHRSRQPLAKVTPQAAAPTATRSPKTTTGRSTRHHPGSSAHLDAPGAKTAIFKSTDGANWDLLTDKMSGGVMDLCTSADGNGVLVATADGEVLSVSPPGETRTVVKGLPCITAMALGA
jgi:photosystem II stability/assembly factor-like uncharacterized protein